MLSLTLSAIAFLSAPGVLLAQQPPPRSGQVEQSLEKKKDLAEPQKAKPKIDIQSRPEMTSEDDAKLRIKVDKLAIVGNRSFPEADLLDVARAPGGVVGREMTLAELKQAAASITQHYRNAGYGLAWAYVPVQDVKKGVVEIAVVEGRVDKILVSGNEHYSADFIVDHVERLQKQNTLSLASLEKGLMVLNSYPGLSVGSTLRQGDTPGTTDLYLTAQDKFPIGFSMDFDNYGPQSTGEYRMGATVTAFNLFDEGHWVSLRGVTTVDRSKGETTNGRIDYTVPFKDGSKVSAFASLYKYDSEGTFAVLKPAGDGEVFGINLSHPLILNHTMSLTTQLGFEYKTLNQELLGQKTSKDQIRVLNLGAGWEYSDDWNGRWVVQGDLSQGLGSFLGGTEEGDPDASRAGASNSYTRLNLTLFRLQRLTTWLSVLGKFQGQYSPHELFVSEQFALGGQDSVRGYAPFEFMGDRGMSGTVEARVSLPFLADVADPITSGRSIFEMVQLAGFIDSGSATRINTLFNEPSHRVLTGAGGGLRINYPDIVSIRFDVGVPITDYNSASNRDIFYYVSVILNLH